MTDNIPSAIKTQTPILSVTPTAIEKIRGLMAERNLTDHGLRVFVAGGGCSGMQYGMALEGNPQPTDHIMEVDGIKVIVDPISLPYIQGSEIDFVDSLMGGGFRIDNPNAVSTCGCGHSFRASGETAGHTSGGGCSCH